MQPKIYIAATAGATGTTYALLYIEVQADVFGWFLECTAGRFSAAFFMLENFYAHRPAVLYRSMSDDVYGQWIRDHPPAMVPMRCPVPESVLHELECLKSTLVQDWLFFAGEPGMANELATHERHDMTGRAVSIKARKLSRLAYKNDGWQYWNAGFDRNMLDYLLKFSRTDHAPAVRT